MTRFGQLADRGGRLVESNRGKIILAARKMFARKGIHQATLGDIAREAGVAKGTLYYYYNSKESLVFEVLDQGIEALMSGLAQLDRRISLDDFTKNFLQAMINNQELIHIYFHLLQESFHNPSIRERFQHKYRKWREWGAALFYQDSSSSLKTRYSPENLSALWIAAIDGICLQWIVEPEALDLEQLSKTLAGLLEETIK